MDSLDYIYLALFTILFIKLSLFCTRRFKKFDLSHKHVILTNCTSSLGQSLARECFFKGAKLTLVDRNKSSLQSILQELEPNARNSSFGSFVQIFDSDLCKNDRFEDILKAAETRFGPVHLFISCAELLQNSGFMETSVEKYRESMENSYLAVVNTLVPIGKVMAGRGKGRICVVCSAGCYGSVPGAGVGLAGAAAVHALACAVGPELEKSKVHLSIFAVGTVENGVDKEKTGNFWGTVQADDACSELLRGVAAGDRYITTGFTNRLLRIVSLGAAQRKWGLIDIVVSPVAVVFALIMQKVNFHKLGY
jgi:short-subunit dehydrogenase